MKDTKSKEQELAGPQAAVQRYLDDLLQEATGEPEVDELENVSAVEEKPEVSSNESDFNEE